MSAAAVDAAATAGGASENGSVSAGATPSWRDALPEDIRGDASLASFKDVPALAKSFIETKKLVGQKSAVPTDKSTPEEVAAFNKALGVPESPTQYQIKRPDAALDLGWDSTAEGQFLQAAHKNGMTPKQVQAAIDWYGQWERAKLEKARGEANAVAAQLRTEWGANYDAMVGRANRVIKEYGGDALDAAFTTPGHPLNAAGRHPLFVKFMATLGDALVESGTITGEGVATLTPEEAKAKVAELRQQLEKVPEGSPRSKELIDQIIALTRSASGGR